MNTAFLKGDQFSNLDNLPGIYSERIFILNNDEALYQLDQLPNYSSKFKKQPSPVSIMLIPAGITEVTRRKTFGVIAAKAIHLTNKQKKAGNLEAEFSGGSETSQSNSVSMTL